ncbi:MAG: head GIN domain-containing protein [Pseudomonadota bacterium]
MSTWNRVGAVTAAAFVLGVSPAFAANVTESYDLSDFDKIEIAGVFDATVTVGGDVFAISLEGPEAEMARTTASVENGVLVLKQKGESKKGERQGVDATIALPALSSLEISGVAQADVTGVDAGDFDVRISGVGEVDVDGACETLTAKLSGVGELNARGLECAVVDVSLSGVGDATVFASERIKARVGGMGEIDVYGDPKEVDANKGFLSKINIR